MNLKNNLDSGTFPNHYVPNSVKNDRDYGRAVFRAIMKATSAYREERGKRLDISRTYAKGNQGVDAHLKELNIDGSNAYVNISFQPTKVLSKFEKIVVDDYQQLQEEPKVIAESYSIQERKEKNKSDLKFRMEFGGEIEQLEQMAGFKLEDSDIPTPNDKDELELITSLLPDEREELLMNQMVQFALEDNDFESKKRQFLSDMFQVQFGGFYNYIDNNGRLIIEYVRNEDAIYDFSREEDFNDSDYKGHCTLMNVASLRTHYDIKPEQEHLLFELARTYRNSFGNDVYNGLPSNFNREWRNSDSRPYDDFSVEVYRIWYKTVKRVGFVEGKDSYGKTILDIDTKLEEEEGYLENNKNKRFGASYIETAYDGLFVGGYDKCIVLEWGEQANQIRVGEEKTKVESPYIFFMPENRGDMNVESSVHKVIPYINMMDMAMLKIKMTIAQHAPSGYAMDISALLNVDIGRGGDESPLTLQDIYQQTGRLFYNGTSPDGQPQKIPIQAMHSDLVNPLNGYLLIYNTALNEIQDTLGLNPNRLGTAEINRASNTAVQTQIAISQTATYFMYRAYIKATEKLMAQIGTRQWNALKYGNKNKGYLKYLGKENVKFIESREDITKSTYKYKLSLQMTQEDKTRLDNAVNACLSAGTLEMPDAMMIWNIKDIDIAEKMLTYIFNKRQKERHQQSLQVMQQQSQSQAEAGVAVEQEKQNTIQIEAQFNTERAKMQEEGEKERALAQVVATIIKTNVETGAPIPDMYLPLVEAYIESHTIRQQKQQAEAEVSLEAEVQQMQGQAQIAEIEQAYQNGDITEQEYANYMSQMGAM